MLTVSKDSPGYTKRCQTANIVQTGKRYKNGENGHWKEKKEKSFMMQHISSACSYSNNNTNATGDEIKHYYSLGELSMSSSTCYVIDPGDLM